MTRKVISEMTDEEKKDYWILAMFKLSSCLVDDKKSFKPMYLINIAKEILTFSYIINEVECKTCCGFGEFVTQFGTRDKCEDCDGTGKRENNV